MVFAGGALADRPGTPPETYLWKPVAIGGGGFITGLDVDPEGRSWIARTDVHGAYLWLDDQDRWAQLATRAAMPEPYRVPNGANEGVYAVAVAPSDPDRLYMALKGRVFRSMDRGLSFEETGVGRPFPVAFDPNSEFRFHGPFLSVSPSDPDLVLFGTPEDGLWRSVDGGGRWARVPTIPLAADLRPGIPGVQTPGIVTWFAIRDGAPTGEVWAMSAGHGVFVSTDGGARFTPLGPGDSARPRLLTRGAFTRDGSFYGVDLETESAWVHRDGRWRELSGTVLPRARFAAVAIQADPERALVFDEGGRAFRSAPLHPPGADGDWQPLTHRSAPGEGDPPWLRVSDQSYFAMSGVRTDPVTAHRIWVGAGTGVYFADLPPGATVVEWRSRTRGIEELVARDVAQAPGRAPLFAFLDFGIHVKADLDAFSITYGPKERVTIAGQQIALSPADPDFVVTNASDTRTFCCSEDGDAVLAGYSVDAGRSWWKFRTLPTPPGTRAGDPWRMSFGTIAVSAGDTANIVWAPSYNRSPFFTRDRGASWQRVVLPGETLPETGSHATIYLLRETLVADGLRAGVFYLVHSGEGENAALAGLWRTSDGGASWTRVHAGEIAPRSGYAAKLRAVPGREGDLFFTSAAGGEDSRARRSRDGGATWEGLVGIDQVDDFAFGAPAPGQAAPTIFLSGRVRGVHGIWRSTDDGGSWRRIGVLPIGRLDQVVVMGADPDRFGRVYLGYMGSGFIHGEPRPCVPAPAPAFAASECSAVE